MTVNRLIRGAVWLITCFWLNTGFAQNYIDLGPPFIELKSPQAPGLTQRASPANTERDKLSAEFAAGRYQDAVGSAQVLLAQAREKYGDTNPATVPALIDLGAAQHHAGDYAGAAQSYSNAIAVLDTSRNGRDPRLAAPLYGLGVAQMAAGNYAQAVDHLQRAVFITRVNDGLHSLNQLQSYPALIEGQLALGLYDAAVGRQKAGLAVVQQATGIDSPEATAALEQTAWLYRRIGNYAEERDIRRREVRRLSKANGYDDISLVPKLRELAATYRLDFRPDNIVIGDLERALEILDKHPEVESLNERVAVLVELGDVYLTFRQSPRAIRYYKQAYKLLKSAGEDARIQALFSQPVPVFVPRPDSAPGVGDQPAAGLPVGYMLLGFDLGSTGRPQNVKSLELEPASASIMRPRAARSMRDARFRPVIGPNGVESRKDVRYKMRFNYKSGDG